MTTNRKYIIFSDSHGRDYNMRDAMSMHRGADGFFFLGDGCADFERLCYDFTDRLCLNIAGNGELLFSHTEYESERLVTLGDFKIFLCHGHRYHVKYGYTEITYRALELDADMAIFGHTHDAVCEYIDAEAAGRERPLWLCNPGSISRPNCGANPSFGILDIGRQIHFTIAELKI